MKRIINTCIFILLLVNSSISYSQNQATIDKDTKEFGIYQDPESTDQEYQIFGYELANSKSKKLICFSVFTDDVKQNKYMCKLGAYYESTNLNIIYLETINEFVKLSLIDKDGIECVFFIELKNIEFM